MNTDRGKIIMCIQYKLVLNTTNNKSFNYNIDTAKNIDKLWNSMQKTVMNAICALLRSEEKRAQRVWCAIKHFNCRGTEICRKRAAANYDDYPQIIYVILIL